MKKETDQEESLLAFPVVDRGVMTDSFGTSVQNAARLGNRVWRISPTIRKLTPLECQNFDSPDRVATLVRDLQGWEDGARVYLEATKLFHRFNLGRIALIKGNDLEKGITLTICGIWRIHRRGEITWLSILNLKTGRWNRLKSTSRVPDILDDIMFWPVGRGGFSWAFSLLRKAGEIALLAAGSEKLNNDCPVVCEGGSIPKGTGVIRLTVSDLESRFLNSVTEAADQKDSVAHVGRVIAGGKLLRKAIYKHILSKPVFSAVLSGLGFFTYLSLGRYLNYARYADDLLSLRASYPNRMPLIARIEPHYWRDPNLFSREVWIRRDGQTCLADSGDFWRFPPWVHDVVPYSHGYGTRHIGSPVYCSVTQRAHWRTLLDLPNTVLRAWLLRPSEGALALLSVLRANTWRRAPHHEVPAKLYVVALKNYMRIVSGHGHIDDPKLMPASVPLTLIHRAYQVWLEAAISLHQTRGFSTLRAWLSGEGNPDHLMDFLLEEGFSRGMPRQGQSYESIMTLETEHRVRVIAERKQAYMSAAFPVNVLGDELQGFQFTPLCNGYEVAIEGERMNHCVASFIGAALSGKFAIFHVNSISDAMNTDTQEHATLMVGLDPPCKIIQLYGYGNCQVSPALALAANSMLKGIKRLRRK